MRINALGLIVALWSQTFSSLAKPDDHGLLAETQSLTHTGNLSAQILTGIDKSLSRESDQSISNHSKFWNRDFSSPSAYEKSVETNRSQLQKIIGAVDPRLASPSIEIETNLIDSTSLSVQAVRWLVFEGVHGEGLLLRPKSPPLARVIAIPDADQTPETLVGLAAGLPPERQFARRLVENGCEVLVPVLINRQDTWSGNEELHRFTNQPHREWIYRQAVELGRHIIGYEVQKVLAAVDCWQNQTNSPLPIGVAGYAEGGLIAFYSAALDLRIHSALVSGYFDSHPRLSQEPIYRHVFGLREQFGDAEIATLIAPRSLIVEHSLVPKISGPPSAREGRSGTASGKLQTPDYESVEFELERARKLLKGDPKTFDHFTLISGNEGMATGPASDRALVALLNGLDLHVEFLKEPSKPPELLTYLDPSERQHRQLNELETFTQQLLISVQTNRPAINMPKFPISMLPSNSPAPPPSTTAKDPKSPAPSEPSTSSTNN